MGLTLINQTSLLSPVREECSAGGTADHLLLGVGPEMLLQLGDAPRLAAAGAPPARDHLAPGLLEYPDLG